MKQGNVILLVSRVLFAERRGDLRRIEGLTWHSVRYAPDSIALLAETQKAATAALRIIERPTERRA